MKSEGLRQKLVRQETWQPKRLCLFHDFQKEQYHFCSLKQSLEDSLWTEETIASYVLSSVCFSDTNQIINCTWLTVSFSPMWGFRRKDLKVVRAIRFDLFTERTGVRHNTFHGVFLPSPLDWTSTSTGILFGYLVSIYKTIYWLLLSTIVPCHTKTWIFVSIKTAVR